MSGSNDDANASEAAIEKARRGIEQAETGGSGGVEQIGEAKRSGVEEAEAAEQEASDGPEGRGLAR